MKRVIKNQKKMKNTMYIVFGVFALALFIITRTNTSYANDGLNIDRTLDAIVLYWTVETEADEEDLRENDEEDFDEEDDENHDKNQDEEQWNEEWWDEEQDEQEEQEQWDEQQWDDESWLDDEQMYKWTDELNNDIWDDSDDNDEIWSESWEEISDENKNLVDAGDIVEGSKVEEPEIILDDEISQSSEEIGKNIEGTSDNVVEEWKEGYELLTTLVDEIQNENIEIMSTTKTVTYHPNWWAFSWMGVNETKNFTYNYSWSEIIPIYNIQIPNRESEDMSVQSWWMFAWWYTKSWIGGDWWVEFDPGTSTESVAYAKWLPFNDLEVIVWDKKILIMDRNMWAESDAEWTVFPYSTQHEDSSKLGLLYQRWNNYWFSNSVLPKYSTDVLVNTTGFWPWNYYYNNVFRYVIDKNYTSSNLDRWTIDDNYSLWWRRAQEDSYKRWMCPEWYHIPVVNERQKLTYEFNSWYETQEGIDYCWSLSKEVCLLKKYKIPVVKELFLSSSFYGSSYTYISSQLMFSDSGIYRSSSTPTSDASGAYLWEFDSWNKTIVSSSYTSRTAWGSVRCFKDTISWVPIVFNSNWWTNYNNTYSLRRRDNWVYFSNPTRSNSSFKWWYDTQDFSWKRIYSNAIYADSNDTINLYAKRECELWTREAEDKQSCIVNTVTIYPNWWEWEEMNVEKVIPKNPFFREWYEFLWWNTLPDWNWEWYWPNNYLNTDLVLYAQWERNPSYVYNANWWEFHGWTPNIVKKSSWIFQKVTVTNKNHQNETYKNVVRLTGAVILSVSGTFNASCKSDFRVYNYDRMESEEWDAIPVSLRYWYRKMEFSIPWDVMTIETIWDSCPAIPYTVEVTANWVISWYLLDNLTEIPILTWYTFSWRYESWALEPFNFTWTPVTQDRIFYAKWNPNKYTIQLDSNWWNSLQTEIDATYWEEIILPNATRDGYVFKWWKDENWNLYVNKIWEDESLTTGDWVTVTLTAQWEENKSNDSGSSSWWGKRVPSSDQDHGAADDKKTDDKKSEDVIDDTDKTDIQQKDASDNDENKSDKSDISENIESQTDISSENQVQYTNEQKESYSFAKSNWITTTSSIKEAKMNTSLKRIEMAKMLSYYAINVLWQEPDTSKWIFKFNDVSNKMDKQYDNWVTLSYQLWIMWQNMPKNNFRPNDEVTRAEFVTALSRMVYNTQDWKWNVKYYEPHMAKLYNEWIISNTNPKMKEKRWYVMTMLMRSAK